MPTSTLKKPGLDPVLGMLVPAEVGDAPDGPTVAVDRAALQRRVDGRRRHGHGLGATLLQHGVVDRRRAQGEAVEATALDFLGGVDVERHAVTKISQELGVQAFVVQLVEHLQGTALAHLADRHVGQHHGVALYHGALVVGGGARHHVDDAGLEGIGLLEGLYGPGRQDVDPHLAQAGLVDVPHPFVERPAEGGLCRQKTGGLENGRIGLGLGRRDHDDGHGGGGGGNGRSD